jgi:nucleoside phosphorylase
VVDAVYGPDRPEPPPLTLLPNQTVAQLGTVSRTRVMLAQIEPGNVGPGSAAIAAAALITRLSPDFLLLAGICLGLRPEWQDYGDILVCNQLRAIDHRRVTEPDGSRPYDPPRSGAAAADLLARTDAPEGRTVLTRGDHVTPSPLLLGRFHAVEQQWKGGGVHFGPMLSASTLVDSRTYRDELSRREPDAIGLEMEGAGVYAAAAHAKVDWIVIKAISDWGFARSYEFHDRAARNAADFIARAAERGLFDEPPIRGAI